MTLPRSYKTSQMFLSDDLKHVDDLFKLAREFTEWLNHILPSSTESNSRTAFDTCTLRNLLDLDQQAAHLEEI